jgi:hypothetical protein
MEKQQLLRRASSGADRSCLPDEAQKSLAARRGDSAPHRIIDLRNRITAGGTAPPPGAPGLSRAAPPPDQKATGSKR